MQRMNESILRAEPRNEDFKIVLICSFFRDVPIYYWSGYYENVKRWKCLGQIEL